MQHTLPPLLSQVRHLMVLDVESVGLYGEGFAVAFEVLDWPFAQILADGMWACSPDVANGDASGRAWVQGHIPGLAFNCSTTTEVRQRFWSYWLSWRAKGALLVADHAWPVETGFLSACVHESKAASAMQGPYPLLDLAVLDTLWPADAPDVNHRLDDELPAHDPRADVRQTCRKLRAWRDFLNPGGRTSQLTAFKVTPV